MNEFFSTFTNKINIIQVFNHFRINCRLYKLHYVDNYNVHLFYITYDTITSRMFSLKSTVKTKEIVQSNTNSTKTKISKINITKLSKTKLYIIRFYNFLLDCCLSSSRSLSAAKEINPFIMGKTFCSISSTVIDSCNFNWGQYFFSERRSKFLIRLHWLSYCSRTVRFRSCNNYNKYFCWYKQKCHQR